MKITRKQIRPLLQHSSYAKEIHWTYKLEWTDGYTSLNRGSQAWNSYQSICTPFGWSPERWWSDEFITI